MVTGAANTDYSGGAVWFLALAAPYIYVAQADEGLKIYKFTDPADPTKVSLQSTYDDILFFGHRVNQVWVRGNRIVVAAVQDNYGVTVADISNPTVLSNKQTYNLATNPPIRNAYGWTLNGNTLYAATKPQGSTLPSGLAIFELDPETWALQPRKEVAGKCSTGSYVATQDDYAFVGLSSCVHKIKRDTKGTTSASDDSWSKVSPPPPGVSPPPPAWTIGIVGADVDFPTPIGNAALPRQRPPHHARQRDPVPRHGRRHHQARRERPQPGRRCRRRRDRPRASASRSPTISSRGRSTRPTCRSGSRARRPWCEGYYSYQLNIVNFRPSAPFAANTQYEVVVTSGIKDLAGNGAVASTATFTY